MRRFIIFCLLLILTTAVSAQETINFPSLDKLSITADLYDAGNNLPVILLCHQAGFSRGEYKEIAKILNEQGFNCMAIDQRSGAEVNNIKNETTVLAKQKKLPTNYLDAEQDIIAAIDYLNKKYNQKVILWGSSYSASLALKIGTVNDKVKAIIAFSPGEYFRKQGINLQECIKSLDKPLFATSSKNEVPLVADLIKDVWSKIKYHFQPTEEGVHGSRSLWKSNKNNEEYWKALNAFLTEIKVL